MHKKFKPPILVNEKKFDNSPIFDQDYIVNKDLFEDMKNRKKTQDNEIEGWTFIGKNTKLYKINK